jgi:hypothetical protein
VCRATGRFRPAREGCHAQGRAARIAGRAARDDIARRGGLDVIFACGDHRLPALYEKEPGA